jgi:hypothetical protein
MRCASSELPGFLAYLTSLGDAYVAVKVVGNLFAVFGKSGVRVYVQRKEAVERALRDAKCKPIFIFKPLDVASKRAFDRASRIHARIACKKRSKLMISQPVKWEDF